MGVFWDAPGVAQLRPYLRLYKKHPIAMPHDTRARQPLQRAEQSDTHAHAKHAGVRKKHEGHLRRSLEATVTTRKTLSTCALTAPWKASWQARQHNEQAVAL